MACSTSSPTTIPLNTQFYAAGVRDPEFVQPEGDASIETLVFENTPSFIENSNKDLKSRVVVVVSNTFRNVAIIETTRFLAIIGLVCSAVASVLLPALGFAAIAAGACILKNRAIQLDAKALEGSDVAAEQISNRTFTRSESTASRTSEEGDNRSITMLRGISFRSKASMAPITEDVREEAPTDIKEAFLNSWGDRGNLNIEDLHGLLTICYSYLLGKTADMPKSLIKEGLLNSRINTQTYFEKKFKDCLAKTSEEFKGSVTLDNEGHQIPAVNKNQKPLESANPSLIMGIVQELHRQISREQYKHKNKTEANHHTNKAEHAGEYIKQLEAFESQQKMCFTENLV